MKRDLHSVSIAAGAPSAACEEITPELICELTRSSPLITVIGDVILDSWMQGRSTRLAREAPVPVVEQGEETLSPGGAANTAMNLASLGARVRLIGAVGDDESGAAVRRLLAEANVDVSEVVISSQLTTTKKTRVLVDDHILLRLDTVPMQELDRQERQEVDDRLCRAALAAAADSDALVIADYGGPVHDSDLPRRLAGVGERPMTIVDAHQPEHWRDLRPTVVTPNVHEVEETLHASFRSGRHRVTLAQKYAPAMREATNASAMVITLDRDGAVAVDEADSIHVTQAQPVPESQASGAGDTFVAGLALAMSAGFPLNLAAEFAQLAANVVVHKEGTSLCSAADLLELVGPDHRSAEMGADAQDSGTRHSGRDRSSDRGAARRTVLALGLFEPGSDCDSTVLESARALGDFLVVALSTSAGLSSTDSTAATMALLSSDPSVDVVTTFSGDATAVVETVRPDVIAIDASTQTAFRPAELTLRFSHLGVDVIDLSQSREAAPADVAKEAQ
ncbi:PfkB family carbohydrate kinase [Brevibacterium sp.]|uniref:PfkB family carbohydrate kinase n=1 Tax=Brevibacterium sp. TaxID=1701 RepID=UPI00281169A5|nr:PfkB family carbohydrate kinase [Brevibacterium sp.]